MQGQREFTNAQAQGNPQNEAADYRALQEQASQAAKPGLDSLEKSRPGHMQQSIQDVSQNVQGLTPFQRSQLQETASNQINKDVQNYSRQLASSAGRRGVRGGSAQAQQMELQNKALDTRRQFERDIGEKDIDIAMQKLAAALSLTEGKQAQQLGAEGEARDYIEAQREKRRQNALAALYNKNYAQV